MDVDYAKAEKALHKLMALYPDDKSGHNYLGVLYVRLSDDEKAIYHYGKAIEAGTEDVVIYTNLANVYLSLGMFDKQVALLKSYIERFSDSDHIRRYLADSYRVQGKFDLAFDELAKAEKLDPGDWMITADKGIVYLYSGESAQSESIFDQLMQEEEPAIYGWNAYYLSGAYLLQGKFAAFDELVKRAYEHAEENGQVAWQRNWLMNRADVYLRRGKFEQALQSLDQALNLTKTQDYAQETSLNSRRLSVFARMQNLAMAEKAAKEFKASIENLSENIPRSPRPPKGIPAGHDGTAAGVRPRRSA